MRPNGFSLLEVMIAMAILAVGAVGALAGVLSANESLREGQLRVYKQNLVEATLQRTRLQNKERLYTGALAITTAAEMPTNRPLGTAPWVKDPTPPVAGDLSTGSLFIVRPDGTMRHCDASTTPQCANPIASCADPAIPLFVFCREVATTRSSATFAPGAIVPAGAFVTTRWVRVVQNKRTQAETRFHEVMGREVFAQ
ncbi:MAG: type IV pilus modification PilV family protein [Myxococcota bacterium]